MDIESLNKYISLVKLKNDIVEVSFAGQNCLVITSSLGSVAIGETNENKSYSWRINPVFAKLSYGANIFSDIPYCSKSFKTVEDAIADGLIKLHELGAFNTEVDLPEDSYAATVSDITEDVKKYSISNTKSIFDAHILHNKLLEDIYSTRSLYESISRSEYSANNGIQGIKSPIQPKTNVVSHKLKNQYGNVISSHDTESGAITAFNNLANKNGVKIVKEDDDTETDITPLEEIIEKKIDIFSKWVNENSLDGTTSFSPIKRKFTVHYNDENGKDKKYDRESYSPRKLKRDFDDTNQKLKDITHNGKSVMNENSDDDYTKWEDEVKKTHPDKKLKFKGRIESGMDTISAEEPGKDRSYGVWCNKTNTGKVFKINEETGEIE